jgi:hypothetical protein
MMTTAFLLDLLIEWLSFDALTRWLSPSIVRIAAWHSEPAQQQFSNLRMPPAKLDRKGLTNKDS